MGEPLIENALSQLNTELTDDDIRALNDFSGYLEFVPTKVFRWLINCPAKIIVLFTGNQFGKNETVIMDYYFKITIAL